MNRDAFKRVLPTDSLSESLDGDLERVGVQLAHATGWDGLRLLKILYAALEDSNFHEENIQIQAMIDKYEGVEKSSPRPESTGGFGVNGFKERWT